MHNLVTEHQLNAALNNGSHIICRQDLYQISADAVTPQSPCNLKRKYQELDPSNDNNLRYAKRSNTSTVNSDQDKFTQIQQVCNDTYDNIEYVLFDENFLPVTHDQQQHGGSHQTNGYLHYSLDSSAGGDQSTEQSAAAEWANVDLLDLDQRQWFFEETPSANTSSHSEATSTGSLNVSSTVDIRGSGNGRRTTDGDLFCLKPTPVDSSGSSVTTQSKSVPSEFAHK